MRTKQMYESFKNSQKIRIMVNGFGMYMQIKDIPNICTTIHRVAVEGLKKEQGDLERKLENNGRLS